PSRVLLNENGSFDTGNINPLVSLNVYPQPVIAAQNDITVGQLAQRSLAAMRKFFPRVIFSSTNVQAPGITPTRWYDYNGNGVFDQAPYILQGHECLVFFLGGIPFSDLPVPWGPGAQPKFAMTGFGKDPTNPFTNSYVTDPRYNGNP